MEMGALAGMDRMEAREMRLSGRLDFGHGHGAVA